MVLQFWNSESMVVAGGKLMTFIFVTNYSPPFWTVENYALLENYSYLKTTEEMY